MNTGDLFLWKKIGNDMRTFQARRRYRVGFPARLDLCRMKIDPIEFKDGVADAYEATCFLKGRKPLIIPPTDTGDKIHPVYVDHDYDGVWLYKKEGYNMEGQILLTIWFSDNPCGVRSICEWADNLHNKKKKPVPV
jgi:hypothetical protein